MIVVGFSLFDRDSPQLRAKCRARRRSQRSSEVESGFYNWSRPRDSDAKFACLENEVRADSFLKTACAAYEPGAPDKDDGLKDHC